MASEEQKDDMTTKNPPQRRRRAHLRKRKQQNEDEDEQLGEQVNLKQMKLEQINRGVAVSTDKAKGNANEGTFRYDSSGLVQQASDMGATRQLETETPIHLDGRAMREKQLQSGAGEQQIAGNKLYKGAAGYTDFRSGFRREQNVSNMKSSGAFGPVRASTAIRMTIRMDYQPDICKDYKETGYCGYGDACKFLHDRGDYKSGWQLEKEWEEKEKLRREQKAISSMMSEENETKGEEEEDDGLPFACFICRDAFTMPVVTKCKHYFCEHCALKESSRTGKCAICKKPTMGIFNTAVEILRKQKKEQAKRESQILPPPPPPPPDMADLDSDSDSDIATDSLLPPPPPPPPPM